MDTVLIIANVLSFIGNTMFTLSALLKSRRKILLFQSSNHVLAIVSEYLTNAFSAMAQESISLVRNFIFLFIKDNKKMLKFIISILLLITGATLGVLLNIYLSDNVWYGYLPVLGNLVYSSFVILAFMLNVNELNSVLIIKIGLFVNSILWGIYGYFVMLYPILIFNAINTVFCVISFIRVMIIKKKVKNSINNEENMA